MTAALVALALVGATVRVEGETNCPRADEVAARLAPLLRTDGADVHLARLDDTSAGVRVELHRADGSLVQSRVLAASGSCDTLADTAAVMIAAWESDLAGREPPPPRFAGPAPKDAPAPPAARKGPSLWQLGGAFIASFAGGDLVPGGMAELSLAPPGRALGARAVVFGTMTRQQAVGMGTASWTRLAFAVGPRYELPWKRAPIDLHGELLGAALFVDGKGFRMNFSDTGFDFGVGGGVRLSGAGAALSPWLDFTGIGWLRQQNVTTANPDASSELPRVELLFSAGITFGL